MTILMRIFLFVLFCGTGASQLLCQELPTPPAPLSKEAEQSQQPVEVMPSADDSQIERRLYGILQSTGWFENARVGVHEGVVTLDGTTDTQEHREWASGLAGKTQGVVAVINRIEVQADVRSTLEFAREELGQLTRQAIQIWPLVLITLFIIALAWLISKLVGVLARRIFVHRVDSPLLLAVVVRLFAIPVFLLGVYFVLQIAGLTRLALTLLGGTGLAGIIIGFAFRDIAENFLASLLLSIRNPFRRGDLIEVAGQRGVVQNLNTRSTVLLTLDGTHVQIPNATVYKSAITNFSGNVSRRADFVIGISYDSPTAKAQRLIMEVLRNHPAVLADPEPLVLVDKLGSATVNLRASYWFDSATYAPNKINSALLRISKDTLLQGGIELPDPAREVVFPKGVPVTRPPKNIQSKVRDRNRADENETRDVTVSEGHLANERPDLSAVERIPEAADDLLKH
jgi:small conductance mechanosensitive channel